MISLAEIRADDMIDEGFIGRSSEMREVFDQIRMVAPTDSTVLVCGETGTGKELVARAVHRLSARRGQAFLKCNCAAIPAALLESELFGHEKGAFTGAVAQRIGRFELANRGALFLDEIGEMPLELQPKLLRVLQEREFERLGSSRTIRTEVRLIAATNVDLPRMVVGKHFRADLYYRLNVFPIEVPPLREHREDIPVLVRHFVREAAHRMNRRALWISASAMGALVAHSWPGNIRELQNLIERAVVACRGLVIEPDDLWPPGRPVAADPGAPHAFLDLPFNAAVAALERELIRRALEASSGNRTEAARRLQINRRLLYSKMRDYDLN
jgi:formate hydrogenlyase transcriptional activator